MSKESEQAIRPPSERFVLGLDLDGCVADFYGYMREVAAEWTGVPVEELTPDVSYGMPEWKLLPNEYPRLHRFAVTQRDLFKEMAPVPGAPQSIRRLGTEGIRIRIITHRLFIRWFHEIAVAQTVRWLDNHAVPYWDLCFMRDKEAVDAHLYVEDTPENIGRLVEQKRKVIVYGNSANATGLPESEYVLARVTDWSEAEELIREEYYSWLKQEGADLPPSVGVKAPWHDLL
ncbi:5' nucleotidase, NT5C type [Mycobacterium hubeiense]|uniref:5' nucleotidase, NT5C type n=1 Tax=Mycobacterium hubeiense TaxID=1867256 RepID=UPI0018ECCFAF|nr:hypothetical protein [Mycobacterium sp. QGD 101]